MKKIPRGRNSHADSLAMLATSLCLSLLRVVVEDMNSSSLTKVSSVGVYSIHVRMSWMDPIVTFLKKGVLPEDKHEAEKMRKSAPHYWLSEE